MSTNYQLSNYNYTYFKFVVSSSWLQMQDKITCAGADLEKWKDRRLK